ncbi:MAG: hypothetical protein WCL49_08795 [bacterium]
MKLDLEKAPLTLLVEGRPQETADQIQTLMSQHYDQRLNDDEFGPLYRIGEKYKVGDRVFFRVQTFAGSLLARMMIDVGRRQFPRAILMSISGETENGYELVEPENTGVHIDKKLLIRT